MQKKSEFLKEQQKQKMGDLSQSLDKAHGATVDQAQKFESLREQLQSLKEALDLFKLETDQDIVQPVKSLRDFQMKTVKRLSLLEKFQEQFKGGSGSENVSQARAPSESDQNEKELMNKTLQNLKDSVEKQEKNTLEVIEKVMEKAAS